MAVSSIDAERAQQTIATTVKALFLHGPRQTMADDTEPTPMIVVSEVAAITGTGLQGAARHMRATRRDGRENKRQVSLIDEGTLERHFRRFGAFPLEFVKSQIVLDGDVHLPDILGREVVFGEGDESVVLQLTIKRDPCEAMDLIAPGLREAMKNGEQGALARVVRGGRIVLGQKVTFR
jgi:hypothetical protein